MVDSPNPAPTPDSLATLPEPLAIPEKGISLVWLVPLVAALIAAWIGWMSWSERGATIHITFHSAEGIEPGKTRIRYRNVDLGRVTRVSLGADQREVMVTAEMSREAEPFLNASTRFWVVRPRIDPGGISGLTTLVSGAYIELDPGSSRQGGARIFMGLKEPPVITHDAPGSYLRLQARQLGSIGPKSPVYHRRIQVGEVVGYQLLPEAEGVEVQIFLNAPYDRLVYQNTRFWHAGGVEASLDANGFQFRTEAVRALIAGGIAFGIPEWEEARGQPSSKQTFTLYDSRKEAEERHFADGKRYLLHFASSVRGLQPGAPVEFFGIPVGQVQALRLEWESTQQHYQVPVVIELEPQRLGVEAEALTELLEHLVANGLRGRLRPGNLLTGQLYIALEMEHEPPLATLSQEHRYPAIPTLAGGVSELTRRVEQILGRVEALPLEQMAGQLEELLTAAATTLNRPEVGEILQQTQSSLVAFNRLLASSEGQLSSVTSGLNETLQQLNQLLQQAEKTLQQVETGVLSEESELRYQLFDTLNEVDRAARSIREVAEYLERHPDALLLGRQKR